MSAGASNVDAVSDNQNKEVGKAHGADNRYVCDENPCLFQCSHLVVKLLDKSRVSDEVLRAHNLLLVFMVD